MSLEAVAETGYINLKYKLNTSLLFTVIFICVLIINFVNVQNHVIVISTEYLVL